ncbi:MAG TPA: ribokinase [Acidimicrobiia bacterium]|nr:ribokinase [Acidimicrobiia bacterium]
MGSVNLDLVAYAPALPRPGETVTDATLERHPGGKGANQALAARRFGSEVRLVARVGEDLEADLALRELRADGVDLSATLPRADAATGVALIVVAPDGENQIVVAPGANRLLGAVDVTVGAGDTVVCQLEIPVEAVEAAIRQAAFGILNCAPARDLPVGVLDACDLVVVNETERAHYGDALDRHPLVVETLGARGARVVRRGVEDLRVPSVAVEAIDSVGAGDSFVGALAAELTSGRELPTALRLAAAAGALATTKRGAQPAIPYRQDVVEFLGEVPT